MLVVAKGLNEPDNNTPESEVLVKIVDIESSEVPEQRDELMEDLSGEYDKGVEIDFYPLDSFDGDWAKVATMW